MARQTLAKQTPVGPYPTLPVAANSLDLTWTAADATNKEQIVAEADILVLVWNTHATNPYTVTFTSAPDARGRSGDVGPYTLQAADIAAFRFRKPGWMQTDLNIYLEANNAAVKYAVLKLR